MRPLASLVLVLGFVGCADQSRQPATRHVSAQTQTPQIGPEIELDDGEPIVAPLNNPTIRDTHAATSNGRTLITWYEFSPVDKWVVGGTILDENGAVAVAAKALFNPRSVVPGNQTLAVSDGFIHLRGDRFFHIAYDGTTTGPFFTSISSAMYGSATIAGITYIATSAGIYRLGESRQFEHVTPTGMDPFGDLGRIGTFNVTVNDDWLTTFDQQWDHVERKPYSQVTATRKKVKMASGGDVGLVVWEDLRSGASFPAIYATVVDSNTDIQGPAEGIIISPAGEGGPVALDVTWTGSRFLVMWSVPRFSPTTGLFAQYVNPDGSLHGAKQAIPPVGAAGPDGFGLTTGAFGPLIAIGEAQRHDVPYVVIPDDLEILRDNDVKYIHPVTGPGRTQQHTPTVLAGHNEYVVSWNDEGGITADETRVGAGWYARKFSINAEAISDATPGTRVNTLTGDGYADLFQTNNESIKLTRFSQTLDPLSTSAGYPSRCDTGEAWGIVRDTAYADNRFAFVQDCYYHGAQNDLDDVSIDLLDASGSLLKFTPRQETTSGRIASNGEMFLAVTQSRTPTILGSRVSTDPDAPRVPFVLTAVNPNNGSYPDVASDGSDFAVVWMTGQVLWARKVPAANIALPDAVALTTVPASSIVTLPRITFDGQHFVVVWQQQVGDVVSLQAMWLAADSLAPAFPSSSPVVQTTVGELESVDTTMASTTTELVASGIDSLGDGASLVVYSRHTDADGWRAKGRLLSASRVVTPAMPDAGATVPMADAATGMAMADAGPATPIADAAPDTYAPHAPVADASLELPADASVAPAPPADAASPSTPNPLADPDKDDGGGGGCFSSVGGHHQGNPAAWSLVLGAILFGWHRSRRR